MTCRDTWGQSHMLVTQLQREVPSDDLIAKKNLSIGLNIEHQSMSQKDI
jgi:hypothetical protein